MKVKVKMDKNIVEYEFEGSEIEFRLFVSTIRFSLNK